MEMVIVVFVAFLLDLLFGDPRWLPHPIRFIGWLIDFLEKAIRSVFPKNKSGEIIGGIVLCVLVVSISFLVPFYLLKGLNAIHPWIKYVVETFFCYQIFATKSLRTESMRVYEHIKHQDIEGSRKYLSWIVGRDTQNLSFTQIIKAVIETIAENTSDGVIAPMLFMMIGGAPLGFFYKAVNTLDSMVGYKNEQYLNFGKFSAIFDDVVNFLPARITGLGMIIAACITEFDGKNAWNMFWRDRHNHSSPNSANPEAACAGALNIQLAGDAYYFGKLYQKKTIGDDHRPVEAIDIPKANKLMYVTASICLVVFETIRIITVVAI